MLFFRRVYLCLKSNIDRYQIVICDNYRCYHYLINNKCQCIYLWTNDNTLKVVFSPLTQGYESNIEGEVNLCCNNNINLSLIFDKNKNPSDGLYIFYLNDKNYGIPLNGKLYFKEE